MLDTPRSIAIIRAVRGYSSVGRARPCQGRGHRFEPGYPLHIKGSERTLFLFVLVIWQGGSVATAEDCKSFIREFDSRPCLQPIHMPMRTIRPLPVNIRPNAAEIFFFQFHNIVTFDNDRTDGIIRPVSGYSSVGRARPCQGRGHRFEPGYPLQIKKGGLLLPFYFKWLLTAGWLSGYGGGLQILYSRVRFSPLPPTFPLTLLS